MKTKRIEVSEDILALLKQSRLGSRSKEDQVRAALAILLCQEGVISVGKAAELAGDNRIEFELMLVEMRLHVAWYDVADHERDKETWAELDRRAAANSDKKTK